MAPKLSAGLLLHRRSGDAVQVLLAHMGGPFWMRKDEGAWSIPKGEYQPGEDPFDAAQREFGEEMGSPPPPAAAYCALGTIRAGGKLLTVWAVEGDFDAAAAVSNTFEMEWPPRSGRLESFPEVDGPTGSRSRPPASSCPGARCHSSTDCSRSSKGNDSPG